MRYLAGKSASGVVTLIAVTVLVFAAMRLVPGTYADIVLGPYTTEEARAAVTASYGLDRPLPVQYLDWLKHIFVGDFGVSMRTQVPVSEILAERLPVTIQLTLLALIIMLAIGIPLAIVTGMARGRVGRGVGRVAGAVGMGTPEFVSGSILLYLFSRYSLGLPVQSYVPFATDPVASVKSVMLPAITLGVFGAALVARSGGDAIASAFAQPHVTAAFARGETRLHILYHHVMRNAAIPIITVIAVTFGYLMGGAVIAENLFSLPGLGQETLEAINTRDYAVVECIVLLSAGLFIAVNIAADFSYGLFDPRIRHRARRS